MSTTSKIQEVRRNKGITQNELAEKVGVTQGAVYQWETGKANPTADKLPALAKALGCMIDDLFETENANGA